jgi:hypothetical protein
MRCPTCSSTFMRPLRPRFWQVPFFYLMSKRPYRCWHCGSVGWVVPVAFEHYDSPADSFEDRKITHEAGESASGPPDSSSAA